MYEPVTDIDPRWRMVHRWIWLAMPDDAAQEVRMTYIEYPRLTDVSRELLISDRLRNLAHQVWRRDISRHPRPKTRPSKLRSATGYRADPERHRAARTKVSAELRAEVARKGQQQWQMNRDAASSARS